MERRTRLTDERLAALYAGDGFGGDQTMRAKVIRELIDGIRALRVELGRRPDGPVKDFLTER